MNTIWPAATLALAVTGYFAWSSASGPPSTQLQIEDCHRLAGEVSAIHSNRGVITDDKLGVARRCAVSFGQDWAADTSAWAESLRSEGAERVQ